MTSHRRRRPTAVLALLALFATAGLTACTGPATAGSVEVLGSWLDDGEDPEGLAFMAVLDSFTAETGIRHTYRGTRDVGQVLRSRADAGTPPDLAVLPRLNDLNGYVRDGALYPLDDVTGGYLGPDGSPQLIQLKDRVYGMSIATHVKSLIWYVPDRNPGLRSDPPRTWAQLVTRTRAIERAGAVPWCLGMGAPPLSGWPGTDWIEDLLLHSVGPADYRKWTAGNLAWSSEPVHRAWQEWREVVQPGRHTGAAILTGFAQSGQPMFDHPPGCHLDHQASFIARTYHREQAGGPAAPTSRLDAAVDFFPFPPVDPAGPPPDGGLREISDDVVGMFRDTVAARALIRYLASKEGQQAWQRGSGGFYFTLGDRDGSLRYDGSVVGRIAATLTTGTLCRDASDLMPTEMTTAFQRAVMEYLHQPARLDALLADLDLVQKRIPDEEWLDLPCVNVSRPAAGTGGTGP